jgi:DNA recombination protein RmuC
MMEWLWPTLVLALVLTALAWWVRSALARNARAEDGMAFLQNQINASSQQQTQQIEQMRGALQELNNRLTQSMTDSSKVMSERLDKASHVISGVSRQLGQLEESSKRIFDVGRSISELEQVLRSPKLRGNIGELFLNELLSQILPPDHYSNQYTLKGGQTVDAVIHLQSGMVPVDAKFPLENFRRIGKSENDNERKTARKAFTRDVKKHIDAIAEKYIRTDEGTFDFALMYVPAENVYYETVINDEDEGGDMALFTYALNKRVIPVSPNSFYAYLQTILLGLKGMRVEESAREMINHIARLKKEMEKFNDAFRLVGTHLERSMKQYGDAEKRMGKIEGKMEQIEGVAGGLSPEDKALLEAGGEEKESA